MLWCKINKNDTTIQSANNAVVYRMCTYVHGKHTEKTGLFPLKNVFEASENQVSHRSAVSVLKEYAPLVRSRACHFASSSNETEDLIQEGNIGLFSAYMNYDSSLSSFGTFAKRCIDAAMIDCLRKTHKLSSVPEDMKVDISGLEVADASPDPAHFVLVKDEYERYMVKARSVLSCLEYKVFSDMLRGYTAAETAKDNGISVKSVTNAISRIRAKLK